MRKRTDFTKDDSSTIIGNETHIVGNMKSDRLVIAGSIEGDCDIGKTMVVSMGGKVLGNISGGRITIEGSVKGDITSSSVEIRGSGTVTGNIVTDKLVVDEGAVFNGHCAMEGYDVTYSFENKED